MDIDPATEPAAAHHIEEAARAAAAAEAARLEAEALRAQQEGGQ